MLVARPGDAALFRILPRAVRESEAGSGEVTLGWASVTAPYRRIGIAGFSAESTDGCSPDGLGDYSAEFGLRGVRRRTRSMSPCRASTWQTIG